jgi:hypothetical protein
MRSLLAEPLATTTLLAGKVRDSHFHTLTIFFAIVQAHTIFVPETPSTRGSPVFSLIPGVVLVYAYTSTS